MNCYGAWPATVASDGRAFVRIVASTLAPVTRIGGIVLFVEGRC